MLNFAINPSLTVFLSLRNGLLIDHYLCEVNGQNVIGLKDKDIAKIFDESPRTVTITIMPKFIYDHLMKKLVRCVCVWVCVGGCVCVGVGVSVSVGVCGCGWVFEFSLSILRRFVNLEPSTLYRTIYTSTVSISLRMYLSRYIEGSNNQLYYLCT